MGSRRGLGAWEEKWRIFDELDHLRECIVEKDHLSKYLAKKTTWRWRHPWPGDTWHLPPEPSPAGGCRRSHRRHVTLQTSPLPADGPSGPCRLQGRRHVHVVHAASRGAGTLADSISRSRPSTESHAALILMPD
jgi:hypothetical protein